MRCPTCDAQYADGMDFCPADGTRLVGDSGAVRTDPLIGAVIHGRYRVLERIGRGGMGAVYRATQVNIDRDVALKVLAGDAADDEAVIRRFEAEAKIISKLRHPNTLKLIDFGRTDDDRLFLVCEYLAGRPLDAILAGGAISAERTLRVLEHACQSLNEAHGAGIVHRDLKPGNLFVEVVGGEEMIKVLDFGIAKTAHGTSHTAAGTVFGTPAYMSPEQARGETVDLRSDIYSLGIIAYECLCGVPPFVAETPVSLLLKHISESPAPLHERVPPVSVAPELESLVKRMLAKDAADRPQTAAELLREVRALLHLPTTTAPDTPVIDSAALGHAATVDSSQISADLTDALAAQQRPVARWKIVAIVAAAVVLLVAAGFALSQLVGGSSGSVRATAAKPVATAVEQEPTTSPEAPAPAPPPEPEATAKEAADREEAATAAKRTRKKPRRTKARRPARKRPRAKPVPRTPPSKPAAEEAPKEVDAPAGFVPVSF